jgi:hypothetical protein
MNKHSAVHGFFLVVYMLLAPQLVGAHPPEIPQRSVNSHTDFSEKNEFQRGVTYASWWRGEYSSPASDRTLVQAIKPLGVNWIAIIATCYQESATSIHIRCKPDSTSPTDADLKHVIQDAHDLGLKVMLKPHIDIEGGLWRGEIGFNHDEAAWQRWFVNYTAFITHYARLAQSVRADYFVVGTELKGTAHRSENWRKVVRAVRREYQGPLTYAAHHFSEEFFIDWWDELDAIGIDAYYPLSRHAHPTVEQIRVAWEPIVDRLGKLSKQWNRPVILTEIGYESLEGSNRSPWKTPGKIIEFEEQADSYQAVFDAFGGHDWLKGMYWWVWEVGTSGRSALNADFGSYRKPADDILALNFGQPSHFIPPPAPFIDSVGENDLMLFHNALESGWRDASKTPVVSIDISRLGANESTELRLIMNPGEAMALVNDGIDTTNYTALEFELFSEHEGSLEFSVSFNDQHQRELAPIVVRANSPYVERGLAGQWQHIHIPLREMGVANALVRGFNIKNILQKHRLDFFIDEIRLVGGIKY